MSTYFFSLFLVDGIHQHALHTGTIHYTLWTCHVAPSISCCFNTFFVTITFPKNVSFQGFKRLLCNPMQPPHASLTGHHGNFVMLLSIIMSNKSSLHSYDQQFNGNCCNTQRYYYYCYYYYYYYYYFIIIIISLCPGSLWKTKMD